MRVDGLVVVWLILLVVTAVVASRKGYSAVLFAIFAFICPPIALIVALAIRPKPGTPPGPRPGGAIRR